MRRLLLLMGVVCIAFAGFAQTRSVSGMVSDQSDGNPLAGVNIVVKGTNLGTSTDTNGRFTIDVPNTANTLIISFVGYTTQEVQIPAGNFVAVSLVPSASELQEVVIAVGSRGPQRTITDTPLPVDNLNIRDLTSTGQITFDKTLQYRVPSFNTVNTPVNDATSLFDPYEIRNLGPSRTLILINGKRKNLTALVYTQTSPGRGETGADLTAIPIDAIKRVEILRDGASAQYGSDAIAGVMNVILKDRYEGTSVSVNTGSTLKYGGFGYGVSYNSGGNVGTRGFINYHASFQHQELTNRKDKIDPDRDFIDLTDGSLNARNGVNAFLARFPDGLNKNGTPENTTARFLINSILPLNDNTEVYGNAAYVYRKTNSFANYRQPYWRIDQGLLHKRIPGAPDYTGDDYTGGPNGAAVQAAFAADKAAGLYEGYIGYQPTFDGDLTDYNATIGLRSADLGGWKQDISLTVGGNKMLFTVENTVNRAMVKNSPIAFKPGGFAFNHLVGNIDFSRPVAEKLFVALGSEFRSENWELIHGDTASYYSEGANSFPGFPQSNAIKANRFNLGAYVDLTWDISEAFLIGGTFRSELYSDFGSANVYKITSRYKIADKLTLRGSVSTGFRAPTLHQKYLSLTQASFVGGDIVNTGLANNLSREARLLGVPRLKAERANNLAVGIGLNPNTNFSLTVDYFYVRIRDRIIYSNEVSDNINGIPIDNISFFINAAETRTSGFDVVASVRNLSLGTGKVAANLAANYMLKNELVGGWEKLNADFGYDIYNQTQESLLTTSRPKYKAILGIDYSLGKFLFNLNNTLFGPTEFNNADLDENLKIRFIPKVVTDLSVMYNITQKLNAGVTLQNILNVFPKYEILAENAAGEAILNDPVQVRDQINNITFNGRYPVVTYDGSHFSQLGTMFQVQLSYKF